MLQYAYYNIKSKSAIMTPETLDGISNEKLDLLVSKLKDESFQFSSSKTKTIPKNSGRRTKRPLAPPIDHIVQEAMRLLLHAIYEPLFLQVSHGFRPHKGCHSALKSINQKFQHSTWIIQGDIENSFYTIDHQRLIKVIEDKIKDRQFTRLLWKCLRAGYFYAKTSQDNIISPFQASIISPLLSNIYLHHLDTQILYIAKNFGKQLKTTKVTTEYNILEESVDILKAQMQQANKIKIKRAISTLNSTCRLFQQDSYKKLTYLRYADH